MGVRSGSKLGFVLPVFVAAWIGCHDATEPPQPVSVRITPAEGLALLPGETLQLSAVANDAGGTPLSGMHFAWHSEDQGVAAVTSSGTVTALAAGSTVIEASIDKISGQATLNVLVPVASFSLNPPAPTAVVGRTVQLVPTVRDEHGHPIVDRPISWASSDLTVALISTNGLLTAMSPGTGTVTATCGGKTATAAVVVLAPIATLRVQPGGTKLFPGDSLQLTVMLADPKGNPLDGRVTSWSNSDSRVATLSDSGLVIARQVGTTFIGAAAEDQSDSVLVEVQARVSSVSVSPDHATLDVGATLQLGATLQDASGASLTGRQVTWSSSDAGVATVSFTGVVTGSGVGDAIISATSESKVGTSALSVGRVASVTISPDTKELTVNEMYTFVATPRGAGGQNLAGREIRWSSENDDIVTVDISGRVTAEAEGTTTIEATSEGIDGHATVTVSRPTDVPEVLVGAGDIATCPGNGDELTAQILDTIPGTVFTAGDNVYPSGTDQDFANCYDPTWGRHKARTRPTVGNHEYETPGAAGYFNYFGAAAGDPATGYYSYDLGAWHILALNTQFTGRAGSPQAEWVRADLAANPRACTLAIWHIPLFGPDSTSAKMKEVWRMLYDSGAEVVINGHAHNYERFAPQTADGTLDQDRGLRQFIIGTGGRSVGGIEVSPKNSEMLYKGGFGVLKLALHERSYDWEFIPVAGTTFSDKGSASCH